MSLSLLELYMLGQTCITFKVTTYKLQFDNWQVYVACLLAVAADKINILIKYSVDAQQKSHKIDKPIHKALRVIAKQWSESRWFHILSIRTEIFFCYFSNIGKTRYISVSFTNLKSINS